jgi:hypothetical protein
MLVRTRPVLIRAAILAGAAGLVIGATVPAGGAVTPGWRVIKTFGPALGGLPDGHQPRH